MVDGTMMMTVAGEFQTRKALIIGINYIGTRNALAGCINDAKNQKKNLVHNFGFREQDIRMLTDDQAAPSMTPTKENIIAGIHWLYANATNKDLRVFHYSGHGTQVDDESGMEPDGKNEAICPVDLMDERWPARLILDNELNTLLYESLPMGVRAFCIFDCCHSGSIVDLNYSDSRSRGMQSVRSRYLTPPDYVQQKIAEARARSQRLHSSEAVTYRKYRTTPEPGRYRGKLLWTFSGCQDMQTSADATINGTGQGACTWAFLSALRERRYHVSCQQLLDDMRALLKSCDYEQTPVLSCQDMGLFAWQFLGSGPCHSHSSEAIAIAQEPMSPQSPTSMSLATYPQPPAAWGGGYALSPVSPAPSQLALVQEEHHDDDLSSFVSGRMQFLQTEFATHALPMFYHIETMESVTHDMDRGICQLIDRATVVDD